MVTRPESVEYDEKNPRHRLIRIAAEQILTGKPLIGCGTLGKALQFATLHGDLTATLLIGGLLEDLLGLKAPGNAGRLWEQHSAAFAGTAYSAEQVRRALYQEVTQRAMVAEARWSAAMGRYGA